MGGSHAGCLVGPRDVISTLADAGASCGSISLSPHQACQYVANQQPWDSEAWSILAKVPPVDRFYVYKISLAWSLPEVHVSSLPLA